MNSLLPLNSEWLPMAKKSDRFWSALYVHHATIQVSQPFQASSGTWNGQWHSYRMWSKDVDTVLISAASPMTPSSSNIKGIGCDTSCSFRVKLKLF